MAKKNMAEVLIDGKIYTIGGYESTEYIQKVANYLNEMEIKLSEMDSYKNLSVDEKQLLKNMNLADEYFKAAEAKERLEQEAEQKDQEIYSLKHDLIDAKMKEDKLTGEIEDLHRKLQEEQRKQTRMAQSALKRKLIKPEYRL